MTCFSTTDQSSVVLQQMFTTMKFTDIAFRAGKEGKIIRAHKNVLAASFEYFDLMFSGSFKESSDKEVVMREFETDILEAVIKFLYLGLVLIPDLKTAIDLWKAAHLMEISALQEHALKYIMDNICSENCLELFLLAEQYELGDLSLKACNFAVRNFANVIQGSEFKQLSKGEIVNYINKLKGTTDENEIARAIFLWIEVDESRQKLHFKELLRLLDIGMIDQQELIDKLYFNCIDMDDSKYMLSSLHKMHFGNTKNLLEPNPEILLLVNALDNDRKALFFYNVAKDTFVGKCFFQINGVVEGVWKSKLIIIQSDLTKRKVITYDLQRKETEIIGSYDFEKYFTCKIINGVLWISSHRFYIKINLQNGESKTVKSNNLKIDKFVHFDDRVYFIIYKAIESQDYWIATYQENDNTWNKVKSFNNSITKWLGWAVVHNDCIYFFGETKLTIYNPKENTCREGMKYEISAVFRMVSIQNKLLVRIKNGIFCEYVDGELKQISSKLNILEGKVLELFTLDS